MPNLLHLVPKLDNQNWQWISYIMSRYHPNYSRDRIMVFKSKDELMFSDLDLVKAALDRSLESAIPRDYDLYRKIYGVPHAKSPK